MPIATKPNIVIIAVDTLRPDHLGCYGYEKPTSPRIDELAHESVVFDTAIAAGIPTMPSFTTVLTGLHPLRSGIVSHIGQRNLSANILTMPQLAKRAGYITVGLDNLVVQGSGSGNWFSRGYDHYSGFLYKPFSDQSAQITDRALRFVDEYADEPMFMFVHYWDPHTPYGPQPPYDTMHYVPNSGPFELRDVKAISPEYYEAFIGDMHLAHPDDYAYVVAQYDGEITQVDAQIGRLLDSLRSSSRWDDTIVVFMSDHGECFGEGNFYFDHHGLYDAVTRIALSIRVPGIEPGRSSALVSTEDILPTLSDIGRFPQMPYEVTGSSVVPLLDGQAEGERKFVVSVEASRQASLALRTREWKVIEPIIEDAAGNQLPDFYGQPRSAEPLLFYLVNDPAESINLAGKYPDRVEDMLTMLHAWQAKIRKLTGEPDPVRAQGISMRYDKFMDRMFRRSAGQAKPSAQSPPSAGGDEPSPQARR